MNHSHNRANGRFGRLTDPKTCSRADLQEAAQLAMQVEFSTIPVYLTGLYSISQPDSEAYQALRSVVVEEMFHLNQAANLLVGIGGTPRFTGEYAPSYPGYLPHANPKTTPYLGLLRASSDVFEGLYAAIETPAPADAPPQGDNYDSIGQLYAALEQALIDYPDQSGLFVPADSTRQRTDIYLGKFGGKPVEVIDLETATAGIHEIVKQGEGSVPQGQAYVPIEPFGVYNHYGMRTDGTYGPIIGTPYELSHFAKFRKVALAAGNFPTTYPIVSNPNDSDFAGDDKQLARQRAAVFDCAYSVMLQHMELSFQQPKSADAPDPYFTVALHIMHHTMPKLALNLMSQPLSDQGDSGNGPNGAPMYRYDETASLPRLYAAIDQLIAGTKQSKLEPSQRTQQVESLHDTLKQVRQLPICE